MAKANPTSPTLLTIIALIADLPAWIRLNQKLINKKEANPIPSQPKNIIKKLSAETNTSIKNVNKDRYPKNRVLCGSFAMYSVEYRWTNDETPVTTKSIIVVIVSNKKDQLQTKSSVVNQLNKYTEQKEAEIVVS